MDEASDVQSLEAAEELGGKVPGFGHRERCALLQDLHEGRTVDVLHGHQVQAVEVHEAVDAADIR